MSDRILGMIGVAAMEKRGLNPETAARLGVFTGRKLDGGEVAPDPDGNILVFPIEENGVTVGEKYRGPNKTFWQKPGSKQVFINGDVLDDPGLYDGLNALTIVEGEPDLITAIDCGFPFSVSVPAGAPAPPREKKGDDPIDDSSGKFSFMYERREQLKKIKRFIIAVDNDTNGKYLAEELVRRLGASRCWFVAYPEGCKDLNDVLMKHGLDAARAVLEQAKPYPLKGVYRLKDYPDKPQIKTYSTGWPILDTIFTPFAPSFSVVTGLPGSGKSTWLLNLAANMADLHRWRWVVFSPEMPVAPHLRDKLRRIYGGAPLEEMNRATLARVDDWINEHFIFIDHDASGSEDDDLSLEWLMDRTYDAMMRFSIRAAIFDPWNEIEHAKAKWESMTEYTNRALRTFTKFTRRYGLSSFLVTHPTKEVGKDGKLRVPTLYDQDGSAAFFNKPDFGIVVHRPNRDDDRTHIYLKKVKWEGTGQLGEVILKFNRDNSRFEQLQPSAPDMLGPL